MKVLSDTSWGADRSTLLYLYRSLIRSKLDYGSIVYGSARKSYSQTLDPVHHQGLCLALGAFRTSPITSLYVEADEPSLYLRREKLFFSMLSNLPLTRQILLSESHFHHNFQNFMSLNLTQSNLLDFVFHHFSNLQISVQKILNSILLQISHHGA